MQQEQNRPECGDEWSQAGLLRELQGFQGAEGQVKLEERHRWLGSGPGALHAVQRNADLILCVEKPSAD